MHKKIKIFCKRLSLFSAIITLGLGYYALQAPSSIASIAFLIWAMSPYAFLTALVNLVSNKTATISALIITLTTCVYGLSLLIHCIFINSSTQTDLTTLVSPLWQWAGLIAIALPLILLNKAKRFQ